MEEKKLSPREVCRLFAKTDRLHRAVIEKGVSATGLHRSQHFLLVKLACLGGKASQKQIADVLMVSAAAVAVSIRKLEEGGYVAKAGCASDARCNEITLTEKGRKIVEDSKTYFEFVDGNMCADISDEELSVFVGCLEKMKKNLLEMEENA